MANKMQIVGKRGTFLLTAVGRGYDVFDASAAWFLASALQTAIWLGVPCLLNCKLRAKCRNISASYLIGDYSA